MIGGFLGAGKTTYLNLLIRAGLPPATVILVNDFGEINIDASLIAYRHDHLIQLQNGCICCTLGGTLAERLAGIMRWPQPPTHVVIEASGVARPGRIADIARVSSRLRLATVISLVDTPALEGQLADPGTSELIQAQIREADILLLNKADRLPPERQRRVTQRLGELNPTARLQWAPPAMTPTTTSAALPAGEAGKSDRAVARGSTRLATFSVECGVLEDIAALERLLLQHTDTLLRAKGRVLTDRANRTTRVLHYVNGELSWSPSLRPAAGTQLVCIGYQGQRLDNLHARLVSLSGKEPA